MCWYCRWGVPVAVADIYKKGVNELGGYESPFESGPAHIVWGDFNIDDGSIKWCIEHFEDYEHNFSKEHLDVVMWSLKELLKIPEKERDIAPYDEFDEYEHHEDFPPTVETVKI